MPEEPVNQPEYTQSTNYPTPPPPMERPQPPKKRLRKGLLIGLAAAAVLVVGGSVAAYNLWYQNPDKVLMDAVSKAIRSNTASYTGSLEVISKDDGEGAGNMKVTFDGKNSNTTGELTAKLEATYGSQSFSISGAGLMDNDANLYFKIDKVREMLESLSGEMGQMPPAFEDIVTKIDGNWIKISKDDLKEINQDYSTTQTCIQDTVKKLGNDKALTQEVVDTYKTHRFIVVSEKLGVENGSIGYVLDYDKDAAKNFAQEFKKTALYQELKKCDDDFDINEDDFTADAEDSDATTRLEVRISRLDHEFTKIKADASNKNSTMNFEISPIFNQPVEVTPPENTVSIKELQKDIENITNSFLDYQTYETDTSNLEYDLSEEFFVEQN